MNESKPVSKAVNFLFNPNGRISRKDIWLKFLLPMLALSFAAGFIDELIMPNAGPDAMLPLSTVLGTLYFWPQICVPVKRFHDRGMSGWWVLWFGLLVIVPAIVGLGGMLYQIDVYDGVSNNVDFLRDFDYLMGLANTPLVITCFTIAIIIWLVQIMINYFLPGDKGPNKYGDDPLNPQTVDADVFL